MPTQSNTPARKGFVDGLKLVNGVWHYKFRIGKTIFHGSTHTSSKDEARLFLIDLKQIEARKAQYFGAPRTIAELLLAYREARLDRSEGFLNRLNYNIRRLSQQIGHIELDKLRNEDISVVKEDYLSTAGPGGRLHNKGGLRTLLIDFRSAMNFAYKRGWMLRRFEVEMPKVQQLPVRALSIQDVPAFLAEAERRGKDEQAVLAIHVMVFLGLRITEVTSMRWEWFMRGFSLYAPHQTKGREGDHLPVPDDLQARLARWKQKAEQHWVLAGRPMPPTVFWSVDGSNRSTSFTNRLIQVTAEAIGLGGAWSPHRMRATCATVLAEAGVSAHHIQRMLRHKNINTTLHYVRVTEKGLADAQQKMVDAMASAAQLRKKG